jgi:hypothetical protein
MTVCFELHGSPLCDLHLECFTEKRLERDPGQKYATGTTTDK